MDVAAPLPIPRSQSLIGNEASSPLVKSSSSNMKFSEHLDENVNQLKKGSKDQPNHARRTSASGVDEVKPQSSARPDTADSKHSSTLNGGVFSEKAEPLVDNVLTNDDGVFLPHDVILNGEAGDIAKKLIPEFVASSGKALPLSTEEGDAFVMNAPVSSDGEADIFNSINLANKLAFNPLGNLTPGHFSQAAMKPVTPVDELEISSIIKKQSELMSMKGVAQTQGLSQFAQQHGELVRDVVNARKEASSEANVNLSSAHLQLNAELNTANKAALSVESPINSSRWSSDLGKNIQWMMNQSVNGAQIRLNPQQLGPIEVRLQMENGQATVAFTAQHAATREAIDAAIPRLREMLTAQDVNLVDVNVSQHSFAEQQQQQGAFSEFSETGTPSEELATNPAFTDENTSSTSHEGLVNEYA